MTRFDAADYLKTDDQIAAYLEDAAQDGDPGAMAQALGTVARARNVSQRARDTGLRHFSLPSQTVPVTFGGMTTPARILRAEAENLEGPGQWTGKDLHRQDRILAAATRLMALHGRPAVTLADLALALAMSPGAIRRYFCDLDNILAEILRRHLAALVAATAKIPPGTPNGQAARRAAYIEATRAGMGGLSEAHTLLVRDRHHLPPDLTDQIEAQRNSIAFALGGAQGEITLGLLDMPYLKAQQVEDMLAALHPEQAAAPEVLPAPEPVPPPQPPPHPTQNPAFPRQHTKQSRVVHARGSPD